MFNPEALCAGNGCSLVKRRNAAVGHHRGDLKDHPKGWKEVKRAGNPDKIYISAIKVDTGLLTNNRNNNMSRENQLALIILAILQSLVLLLLHKAMDHEVWPATSPEWLYASYTVAIGLPLFLYLGAIHWRDKVNGAAALVLAPVLFWLGWHNGWLSAPPLDHIDYSYYGGLRSLGCALLLALFISGFFFRTWREQGGLGYSGLLENSWRNALTFVFLGLFIGVFWLLLLLWAQLFKVINIDFFAGLFKEPVFIYPVTGLVGGWGLGLIRSRENMIATVRNLCETLIRALLPLISLILILFLASLPFTGIDALWETGFASVLMLSLGAVLLYFFNAAAAEHEQPFEDAPWLRRLLLPTLVLAPITVLLTGWSLGLRIDQYGLTVSRLWGLPAEVFIALFSLGYAILILFYRGLPMQRIRQWNTVLGATLTVVLVLAHLPVLDFHRLSANNLVTRLENSTTAAEDFDALYLRFKLGSYGANTLKALQETEMVKADIELASSVEHALGARHRWQTKSPALNDDTDWRREQFDLLPGTELSDEFLASLDLAEGRISACLGGKRHCVLGDFDYRGNRYRAAIHSKRYGSRLAAWQWIDNQWKLIGEVRRFACTSNSSVEIDPDRAFIPVESDFLLFTNGSCMYQLQPSDSFAREIRWG